MGDGLVHRRPHVCCAADVAHHGAHVGTVAPGHLLQVGLRGQGIVEGRVVGGEVHRHDLPATVHQQVHRRRAHAARRAGDHGDRAHDGDQCADTAAVRSRTRASRSASPSSALAPVGSPSTPLDDTGRTPSARSRGSSVAIGSVRPGSANSRRTAPRIDRQQQGGLRPSGVRVPTRRHRSPHEHVVTFARTTALDRRQRLLVPAMGVDEDHAGKGSAGGAHELDEQVGQDRVADEERAREVGMLPAGPVGHGGRHGDAATARRQSRRDGAGDAGVGVEGQVRPVLLERAQRDRQHRARPGRLHLGPGGAGELHGLRCGPASGSGRAWAPGSGSRPGRPWSGRAPTAGALRARPAQPRRARARTRGPGRRGAAR